MTQFKLVNGTRAPLSDEDIAQFEADTANNVEIAWSLIRSNRNAYLLKTDWTQLADAPVDASVWAVYRQALRDITVQSDPFNITWPQEPE